MYCFMYQDWLTLRGPNTGAAALIVQSEPAWLDLSPYQDLVLWLDVREVTPPQAGGTLYLDLQSGPAKDEVYFTSIVNASSSSSTGIALTAGASVMTQRFMRDGGAYVPLSKWLRWAITSSGVPVSQAWDVTFRLWLAASYAVRPPADRRRSARGDQVAAADDDD